MYPKWLKLIDAHQRTGGFGLTLPFILGALRTPQGAYESADQAQADFDALLGSMAVEIPIGIAVRISECGRLRQPVAAVVSGAPDSLGDAVEVPSGGTSRLFAWPDYFANQSRDAKSLARGLWGRIGPPVCDGRFSYRERTYQAFDEADRALIARALAADEDA